MSVAPEIVYPATHIDLDGSAVGWAGEFPWRNMFCFGTESGQLWITNLDRESDIDPLPVVKSGEAINGVAFCPNRDDTPSLMAVSTRAEIVFNKFTDPMHYKREESIYEGGAHGVTATRRGGIIASLGPAGLLVLEPQRDGRDLRREITAEGVDLYFYKVASVGITHEGNELFVGAGRTDGLLRISLGREGNPGDIAAIQSPSSSSGNKMDLVDVCAIDSRAHPFAVAGLGIDHSLILIRDLRTGKPVTMRFPNLLGTPYSILSARGNIFVFTSEGLYVWPDLVDRFLRGEQMNGAQTVLLVKVDAIDCFLAYDEYLLLAQSNGVGVLEVSELIRHHEGSSGKNRDSKLLSFAVANTEVTPDFPADLWEPPREYRLAVG